MKNNILIFLSVLLVALFVGQASHADKAMQVGNKVSVTLAVLADPDTEKTRLMAMSPVLTYKGGSIHFKPDFDFLGGPGSQIGGHLRLIISKDGVYYVFGEPFFLMANHNPSMLVFDPVGEADLDPGINNALKAIVTPNSKIRVGILLQGSPTSSPVLENGRLYYMSRGEFAEVGSALVSDNIELATDYETYLAKGTFVLDNAVLPAGKNKIVW